jgi:hypothetical protein
LLSRLDDAEWCSAGFSLSLETAPEEGDDGFVNGFPAASCKTAEMCKQSTRLLTCPNAFAT